MKFLHFTIKSDLYRSPYDLRIIKWFKIFGHPLGIDNGNSDFDKCILQTNWCNEQDAYVANYNKFLYACNIDNFLNHVKEYMPVVLIFMGSRLINCLQHMSVKNRFIEIFGNEIEYLKLITKNYNGRKFRIGFQAFERIAIISLPHPSGSRGLSDNYIKLFESEVSAILSKFKQSRGF